MSAVLDAPHAELRKPFDHVQQVTKTWKDKNTGERKSVTLDYIGHAVVTDRLLGVDPNFTFEPLLDERGFPIVVVEGLAGGDSVGIWGRLTILGASVVEFCSGKDLMDAYSRCLCRAAMRRGVALDLWIKDDDFKAPSSGAAPSGTDSSRESDEVGAPAPDNPAERARAAHEAALAARTPTDDGDPRNVVLTFGKHKTATLGQVDAGYLKWLVENFDPKTAEQRRIIAAAQAIVAGDLPANPDDDIPF